jgi:hypothetical protein
LQPILPSSWTTSRLFAQHYAAAGLAQIRRRWSKAGHRSAALSAMAEAAAHSKGADQLALLPDDLDIGGRNSTLAALGAVLLGVKGPSAPEMGYAHARARELWEQLGSPSSSFKFPMAGALSRTAAN